MKDESASARLFGGESRREEAFAKLAASSPVFGRILAQPLMPEALDYIADLQRASVDGVYISAPITSGARLAGWVQEFKGSHMETEKYASALEAVRKNVIEANVRAAEPISRNVAARFPDRTIIDPTSFASVESWDQADYHRFWLEVISGHVSVVVFSPEWQYSSGCALEYAVAVFLGVTVLDSSFGEIDPGAGLAMMREALKQIRAAELPLELLQAAIDAVEYSVLSDLEVFRD